MKKLLAVLATGLGVVAFHGSAVAQSIPEINRRCEEDSLNTPQAKARVRWYATTNEGMNLASIAKAAATDGTGGPATKQEAIRYWENQLMYRHNSFSGELEEREQPLYPTFTNKALENPLNYYAPPKGPDHLVPTGYQMAGFCRASCYKPDGLVRFAAGEEGRFRDVPIGAALEERLHGVAVLSAESTLEVPVLEALPVESYTVSATPTDHEIYVLSTQEGHVLEVTGNHPLIDATGEVREADSFEVGDGLVRVDGTVDAIESIEVEPFHGRVYNLAPATRSLMGNVLVANGFLSGSSWYQNEGIARLNSSVFRAQLPATILE